MKILYRQQPGFKLIYPDDLPEILTFWAMPVSARVISMLYMSAVVTLQSMPAQCLRTAIHNGSKSFLLLMGGLMLLKIAGTELPEDICHFSIISFVFHDPNRLFHQKGSLWKPGQNGSRADILKLFSGKNVPGGFG